jgi:flavin reductase
MQVSREEFREAMARLGAAVNVVTTDGPAGRAGLTASAVCSVTDDPPTLLVCMKRNSSVNEFFRRNRVLAVNVLAAGQQSLSDAFAGIGRLPMADRFAAAAWDPLATGAPLLRQAIAGLDCSIVETVERGTHSVFFAEVAALRLGAPCQALIWWGRGYHPVGLEG